MSCCRECEFEELLGVGAVTDAGEFVERVHRQIVTLDADVQRAVESRTEHLRPNFNFGAWNNFVNAVVTDPDGVFDAPDEDYLQPAPHGWLEWRGNLSNFEFVSRPEEIIQTTSKFELEFVRFRSAFVTSGGTSTAPAPKHPGVPKTPQEEEAEATAREKVWTWALVIAGVTAAGYLLSSAAPLIPRK